ncbi:MmcQ/YjbR family DNA-binding protein [Saccharopolyspora karakumensis]|uniref:MmcQ/YjbR family DNA-binding protein n=1 Tax=Saccharopolyspora karakumensis TaxID=2530386 RepID=A0A4R5BA03_9PSEU|nr:MmcQ/YjbR family DNA-binding protein [Saccharopolyspora karakumensis]TDD81490.1 MmcQ/YjbR family DNA-binding protein [Saccharopolyspora karakumensis]
MTTSGEQLQNTARDTAVALPGVTGGRPFTEQLDVYKVAGKVFLIITDDPNELIITVKAEPEYGRLLQDRHTSITPGRYLDKRHWISLGAGPDITRDLIAELVDDSYHLALETVPQKQRPR